MKSTMLFVPIPNFQPLAASQSLTTLTYRTLRPIRSPSILSLCFCVSLSAPSIFKATQQFQSCSAIIFPTFSFVPSNFVCGFQPYKSWVPVYQESVSLLQIFFPHRFKCLNSCPFLVVGSSVVVRDHVSCCCCFIVCLLFPVNIIMFLYPWL